MFRTPNKREPSLWEGENSGIAVTIVPLPIPPNWRGTAQPCRRKVCGWKTRD
jgi:hypothetical protein